MAWENDCGLRSGTFLALIQSNVTYYTIQHFSKLSKNTFSTVIKAAKSNQISQIIESCSSALNTLLHLPSLAGKGKTVLV